MKFRFSSILKTFEISKQRIARHPACIHSLPRNSITLKIHATYTHISVVMFWENINQVQVNENLNNWIVLCLRRLKRGNSWIWCTHPCLIQYAAKVSSNLWMPKSHKTCKLFSVWVDFFGGIGVGEEVCRLTYRGSWIIFWLSIWHVIEGFITT